MTGALRVAIAVLVAAMLSSVVPSAAVRRPGMHTALARGRDSTRVDYSVIVASTDQSRLATGETWMADESPFGVRPDFAH